MMTQNAPIEGSDRLCPNSQVHPQIDKYLLLAKKYPLDSEERKRYFNRLMRYLEPHLSYNSYSLSQEDLDEVKNNVREAIYHNIDRLNPHYIIAWTKKVMKNKAVDRIRLLVKLPKISLDQTTDDGQTPLIEMITQPEPDPAIAEQEKIKEIVDNDPDQMLQKHIQGCPELTWQMILHHRLQGRRWQELAKISGKSVSTLNSFDKREINRLRPYLKEALSSL